MDEQLYRKIEPLKEGQLVNYVGVYVVQWKPSMGVPTVGFIEVDDHPTNDSTPLTVQEANTLTKEQAARAKRSKVISDPPF